MIIKDNKFNIKYFKKFYKEIKWRKIERTLSKTKKEIFYVGKYNDDSSRIKIKIRPSMIMQISESYNGYDKNGNKLPKDHNGNSYFFGNTIEVKIDDQFLSKIEEISEVNNEPTIEKVSW